MANGASMRLADKADDGAPYFSIVLVAGWLDRPDSTSASGAAL
jgi:precorrin-2/cobalt-factor-2 C20-methyltransferase